MGSYKKAREFPQPTGIEQAQICNDSGKLAGPQCLNTRSEYFIAGSEPAMCDLHNAAAVMPAPDLAPDLPRKDAPTDLVSLTQ